jgi:hypothetical protein
MPTSSSQMKKRKGIFFFYRDIKGKEKEENEKN